MAAAGECPHRRRHLGTERNLVAHGTKRKRAKALLDGMMQEGDVVVLVTPIDSAAPKGRLILPQQQVLRDVLDRGGVAVTATEKELPRAFAALKEPPRLVVTDSQAFSEVAAFVPDSVPLTSFSILMARHKGFLEEAVRGVSALCPFARRRYGSHCRRLHPPSPV